MFSWMLLLLASGLEVLWAAGLKRSDSVLEWLATIACIIGSFSLLVLVTKRMGASTAYVFFVIFGTVGTYLLDVALFGKSVSPLAVLAIAVILFSVVQLKQVKD
ncbi:MULTISPECIES: DMT family transporter [Chromobacterium]|uniref:Guanidinium exporter n=2 Tax=Chromobacterium TaxID=535 RepID=A0AAD0RT77_9NEIS|nr:MULTISPECIES: SMR family transporter [Chromobacterium]AXT46980.1 quaternary ammonium compound-resistance protein SugE [Chromobacterium rhizoryzae]QOD80803.1 quaternary ammonium compound-resistance protein SugE [Chromobacterium haemolyticum]